MDQCTGYEDMSTTECIEKRTAFSKDKEPLFPFSQDGKAPKRRKNVYPQVRFESATSKSSRLAPFGARRYENPGILLW
jgi:hypothetical protein